MIGKTIWIFDENRRKYNRDSNGKALGSPIWKEHWAPHEVVDETRISWILRNGRKVSKKGGNGIAFTEEEIDRQAYVADNYYRISDMVRSLGYDKLKQVADLIGYKEA